MLTPDMKTLIATHTAGQEQLAATQQKLLGMVNAMHALEGDIEDLNARTEAESELDEALEAQGEEDWEECVDALEEALEALGMEMMMDDDG